MKGSAPNWPKMGSQTEVRKKLKPNLCRGRTEPCHNSKTRSKVIKTTEAANKNVMIRAISSPSRSRDKNEREPTTGPALGTVVVVVATLAAVLLDLVEGGQFLRHDFLRKFRIRQAFRIVLAVGQHPGDETLDGVALGRVGKFLRNQEPSKAGDGIDAFTLCVGDGDAEIVRHGRGGGSRGGANASQIRLDEFPHGIFYRSVGNLVLHRIDELDVADGIGRLLDETGNVLVALAAESNGPVHRGALANFVLPVRADFGKIVGPDIRRAAAIRTVNDNDVVRGEVHTLVGIGDDRVIPFGNASQKDADERLGGEIKGSGYSWNVVSRNHGSKHRGEMQNGRAVLVFVSFQLIVIHRAIRGTEIDRSFSHLLDSCARADRLIIYLSCAIRLVIFVEPLRVYGVRKRGTRSVNQEGAVRPYNAGEGEGCQEQYCNSLHSSSPSEQSSFPRGSTVWCPIVTVLLQQLHCCLNRQPDRV